MRSHHQQRQARSALLASRARHMLHAPTPSEEALWRALRGGALGVAFKRQVVLGERHIADFFAPSVGLVVRLTVKCTVAAARLIAGGTRRCAGLAIASCGSRPRWWCATSQPQLRSCNPR
jgi:hypothetical protein